MSRKGKWVEISSPDEPAADVARRALTDRLQLVCRYLQRASEGAPSDTENVHQLRVSTRRAVAAIDNFQALLPHRRSRWMLKKLKHVRRAAGAARDLDVMLARFREPADNAISNDAANRVLEYLKSLRNEAQGPIDRIHRNLRRHHFRRRIGRLARRAHDRESKTDQPISIEQAGRRTIEPRVQAFLCAGDADLREHAELHAFRIEAKQLRYAMEIFAAAFRPEFRAELSPLIASLQERLGEVNDHATARDKLATWTGDPALDDDLRSALATLRQTEETLLRESKQEFLDWWTDARRKQFRDRFAHVLSGDDTAGGEQVQTLPIQHRRAE